MGGGFYAGQALGVNAGGAPPLLRLHRPLVPQPYEIAVGIGELGAISPEGFLRAVREGDAARFPLRIGRVDIVDLEPQGAAVGSRDVGFLQENGKAVAVAQRDSAPVGHVELDGEAQRADIPVARAVEVADREIEVVELHHPRLLLAGQNRRLIPPHRTRLPLAPSYITQACPGGAPSSGSAKRTTT